MTISATDILVPVCSKIPLLYLLTQKVAQKFGYVLGIGECRIVCLDKVSYLCTMILNYSNYGTRQETIKQQAKVRRGCNRQQ
jgi:hypothetical protein